MLLNSLVNDLRLDLYDNSTEVFETKNLQRCVRKAIFRTGLDLGVHFVVTTTQFSPDPCEEVRELIVVMAQIHACQLMRSSTANAFSFSSGDKRVDKTSQSEHWAKLEEDLLAEYRMRLSKIKPSTQEDPEAYMVTPVGLTPVIFEQGKDVTG